MSRSIPFALSGSPLHAHFDDAQLTSDGGLCRLSEAYPALSLCALLAAVNRE